MNQESERQVSGKVSSDNPVALRQQTSLYLSAVFLYHEDMKKFSNVHYVDAYYGLEEQENLTTELPHNDAFGQITKGKNNSTIVHFIDKVIKEDYLNDNTIISGLILPARSIISKSKNGFIEGLESLKVGQSVSVTWEDVVHVANNKRNDCSILYTEGIISKNNSDHLVIQNPETIRTHPLPIQNHPKVRPIYYVIPKSFITSINTLKI